MKHVTLLALLVCLFLCPIAPAADTAADTIFVGGTVYTGDEKQPRVEAVAVKGGRILFAGSAAEARKRTDARTKIVDLKGAFVYPGFTDSHCHLSGIGAREMVLNLEGTPNLQSFLAQVKERVDAARPGEWITGRGWIETHWTPPVFPTRKDLDAISPKNPVYLVRADGHGAVANSLALQIAGIDKSTKSPEGGEIMRDKATGEPNGMILDKANALVTRHVPGPTEADQERAILLGVERSLALGWCQIQNAGSLDEDVARIDRLYRAGKIKLRIYNAVYGPGPAADALIKNGSVVGAYDGRFTTRTIKVVMDGALGSKGAALLEPYADHDSSGFLTTPPETLAPMLAKALEAGIQVETHAIGDRANRIVLDLYEAAFAAVPAGRRRVAEPRWRVEHAQIIDPIDIPRFAKLGVIPSMQPSHAIGDLYFAPSRLGMKRLEGAYAWQSLLKTGVIICAGSDAPVERGEPLIEFYAAVARKDLEGRSGEGWHPEQAVTREQALKMLTLWPAMAAFEERERGTIEAGKYADFTIFSSDIMRVPEAEILKSECVMTVVNGEVVHKR